MEIFEQSYILPKCLYFLLLFCFFHFNVYWQIYYFIFYCFKTNFGQKIKVIYIFCLIFFCWEIFYKYWFSDAMYDIHKYIRKYFNLKIQRKTKTISKIFKNNTKEYFTLFVFSIYKINIDKFTLYFDITLENILYIWIK